MTAREVSCEWKKSFKKQNEVSLMFEKIGSVKTYAAMMALQQKVNSKLEDFKEAQTEASARRDAINKKIKEEVRSISTKLKRGGKLTYVEILYLQKNAPDLYKKALQLESESKEFAKKLARCKNKEEAQRLKLNTVSSLSCQNSGSGTSTVMDGGIATGGISADGAPTGDASGSGDASYISDGDFRAMRINSIVREYWKVGEMRAEKNAENRAKLIAKPVKKKLWRA